MPAFAALALLPLFPPPFLDTPAANFGGVMAQFAMYALIAIGLNVVVGQTGLLDLGYVGFYAVGAYTVATADQPEQSVEPDRRSAGCNDDWAWLACLPLAIAVTAFSGLLLGTPTLRLRGDYLAIVTLGFGEIVRLLADNLTEVTNGSLGLSRDRLPARRVRARSTRRASSRPATRRRPAELRRVVVLARHDPGDHRAARGRQPRAQPRRPVVGGDPRGRGRRRDHGRAHLQIQAVGVHDRRGDRRNVRCALRRTGAVHQPERVQHHQLDAVPVRGGDRRPGQQARRDRRRVHHRLPAEPAHVAWRSAAQPLGDYKYLFFGLTLVVLMIFRPQGLFPARQRLLTYGRQVYRAVRKPVEAVSSRSGQMTIPGPGDAMFDNEDMAVDAAPEKLEESAGIVDVAAIDPALADPDAVAEVVAPTAPSRPRSARRCCAPRGSPCSSVA